MCECSNTDCASTIELTVAEYERVRSNSTWFAIELDHDLPQIERVVSQDDGYAVVEKLILEEYMQATDPRSHGPRIRVVLSCVMQLQRRAPILPKLPLTGLRAGRGLHGYAWVAHDPWERAKSWRPCLLAEGSRGSSPRLATISRSPNRYRRLVAETDPADARFGLPPATYQRTAPQAAVRSPADRAGRPS